MASRESSPEGLPQTLPARIAAQAPTQKQVDAELADEGQAEGATSPMAPTATMAPAEMGRFISKKFGAATTAAWETASVKYKTFVKETDFVDGMHYQTQRMRSLTTLLVLTNTVWLQANLWLVALKLFTLSFLVSSFVLVFVQDPAKLRIHRFSDIVAFMRFFVGLLLGFFMSASVQRWWSCANGFMQLFDAVRNLQIALVAMGVPKERVELALRYGCLSCWVLTGQLEADAKAKHQQEVARGKLWDEFRQHVAPGGGSVDPTFGHASSEEILALEGAHDAAECLWIWIGMYIGELAQEKFIPPNNSPTYGRVMNIAQTAHDGIRQVRSNICIQAPFLYVHMLASLVHINNILNAISFGLTSGGTIGTWLAVVHLHPYGAHATEKDLTRDMQSLMASFFFSAFGPIVYQAFLVVAVTIAQPFSSEHAVVPTVKLIKALEKDLHDAFMMDQNIGWKRPRYVPPVPK
mmetsp:Transcript_2141/g.5428  ORF Transcript_2141/g.5428 Transcript_2141/m.5428 type:complete len:465 (+) Transcript_2141:136-1530(+)